MQSERPAQAQNQSESTSPLTRRYALEYIFRISLLILYIVLESLPPFEREIQREEIWRYRYPMAKERFLKTFGGPLLDLLLAPFMMISYTVIAVLLRTWWSKLSTNERLEALLVPTLSIPMTGVFVCTIKIAVGMPRPTFVARCYGQNNAFFKYEDLSRPCTGERWLVEDGRKSFPSGHTSLAFSCFVFLFLYTAGQLGTFRENGRRRFTLHLMMIPYFLGAIMVAISRISEYKHHWEDVVAGAIIGSFMSYASYRIYYPGLDDEMSHVPYALRDMNQRQDEREQLGYDSLKLHLVKDSQYPPYNRFRSADSVFNPLPAERIHPRNI